MDIIVIWIACAVASAVIANSKGRSGAGWFLLGLCLALIAVIIVACLPSRRKDQPYSGKDIGRYYDPKIGTTSKMPKPDLKQCPKCAEDVRQAAIVCKHCGHEFGAADDFRTSLKPVERKVIMRDR